MRKLIFQKVTFAYPNKPNIFEDLSFEINDEKGEGHICALMGASGSGKSTILKLILGTLKPQQGSITVLPAGEPVISYIPQEPILFEHLTPMQNAQYFKTATHYCDRFDPTLFDQLAQSLNMSEILHNSKSVLELSGGQRQRLSLLRALSIRPELLLLDEPTTGLDAAVKLNFLNELRRLVREHKLLAVYVTHNKLETEIGTDEIVYLDSKLGKGPIKEVARGGVEAFIANPPTLEALEVFNYPKPNILRGTQNEQGAFIPNSTKGDIYLKLEQEDIELGGEHGHDFRVVAGNAIFSLIELTSTNQTITVSTKNLARILNNKVSFKPAALIYDAEGKLKTIKTNKNG